MNDEQRKDAGKWTPPIGLHPEIGASGVAALENRTTNACARRLAPRKFKMADFRAQHAPVYFSDRF
jgi:hypothetical protein